MSALLTMMMESFTNTPPVTGGNIAYRSGTTAAVAAGAFTITKPAGVVSGDVMYAAFLQDSGALPTLTGWTQLATANTPTNGFECTLLRRVAGGAEGANYAFATGASVGQGIIIAFSGVNATPEDATTTTATGATATITYPSITSVNTFSWHVPIACNFNALASTPGGYTARQASTTWVDSFSNNIATPSTVSGITSTAGGDWVAFSVMIRSS